MAQAETNSVNVAPSPENKGKGKSGCLIALLIGILVLGLIFICGFIGLMFYAASKSSGSAGETVLKKGGDSKIAVININGEIVEGKADSSLFSSSSGAYSTTILEELDKAEKDENVKCIILKMNTPGGEVVASDIIHERVKALNKKKPVITYIGSMGASGGYYIAVGTRYILVHPSALTGSIGVIMQTSSMDKLYDKLGIQTKTFKSGKYKDTQELYNSSNGELSKIFQDLVMSDYDIFTKKVAEGRKLDIDYVKKLADGRIYNGKQAVENKLADETGYFEDAVKKAEKLAGSDNMTVVEYDENSWGLFSGSSSIIEKIAPLSKNNQASYGIKMYYLVSY